MPGGRSFLWAAGLLPGSSDLPEGHPPPVSAERCRTGLRSEPLLPSYLVLLRVGFALPPVSPPGRCALTLSPLEGNRTFSPLPRPAHASLAAASRRARRYIFCGTFRTGQTPQDCSRNARPILAVSQHTALRSPDFPPPGRRAKRRRGAITRPAHLSTHSMMHPGAYCNSCAGPLRNLG